MSFNVRGSFHDDGANNWDHRRDLNVSTIKKYLPDIIGFQEAQSGNLATYEAMLTDYETEPGLLSIRQEQKYHRVPIYWKRDRFELRASGGFYLSETPDEWSLSWGSTLVRVATWVKLRAVASEGEFVVLNTHFPHEPASDTARIESARLVVRRLVEIAPALPSVVMGDFNALPGSPAYQVLLDAGYTDTFGAAENADPVNTFHGFEGLGFRGQGIRIDWILTKDGTQAITTQSCIVIDDEAPPLFPSDHYPLLANLELA
mgnify:CR=1 FL=1